MLGSFAAIYLVIGVSFAIGARSGASPYDKPRLGALVVLMLGWPVILPLAIGAKL